MDYKYIQHLVEFDEFVSILWPFDQLDFFVVIWTSNSSYVYLRFANFPFPIFASCCR